MLHAKNAYCKTFFHSFSDFMKGVDFNNQRDSYYFLNSFVRRYDIDGVTSKGKPYKKGDPQPCFFQFSTIWSEEKLAEAIDFFFYIFSKDKDAIEHVKRLITFCIPEAGNDEDQSKFHQCLLYGDKICITIAKMFGIKEPIGKNGGAPVFEDWIKAINGELGDFKFYTNALYIGKAIRNLSAHEWNERIPRVYWYPTLKFLLHSYIGLCLQLIETKKIPQTLVDDFEANRKDLVVISTNKDVVLRVETMLDNHTEDIYKDSSPTTTRAIGLRKYTKYNIVIDSECQKHEIHLIATSFNVKIIVNCETNSCNTTYNASIAQYLTEHLQRRTKDEAGLSELNKKIDNIIAVLTDAPNDIEAHSISGLVDAIMDKLTQKSNMQIDNLNKKLDSILTSLTNSQSTASIGNIVNDSIDLLSTKHIWRELAISLNDLYMAGEIMYASFPYLEQSQLLSMMNTPCEGDFREIVKDYGVSLGRLAEVLYEAREEEQFLEEYFSRLQTFESELLRLHCEFESFNMRQLTDIANIFLTVSRILHKPSWGRIITARLSTNIGKCDNANVNAFFLMGNIISSNTINGESIQIKNIGAAILHDLYMALPDTYKRLLITDFSKALVDAKNNWDLYNIEISK